MDEKDNSLCFFFAVVCILVVYGYFAKDTLNISRNVPFLNEKEVEIHKDFDQLDLPEMFKKNCWQSSFITKTS
mgnify:CR=1 FL=1